MVAKLCQMNESLALLHRFSTGRPFAKMDPNGDDSTTTPVLRLENYHRENWPGPHSWAVHDELTDPSSHFQTDHWYPVETHQSILVFHSSTGSLEWRS